MEPTSIPSSVIPATPSRVHAIAAPILERRNCVRVGPRVSINRTVLSVCSPPTMVLTRMMINICPRVRSNCTTRDNDPGRRKASEKRCMASGGVPFFAIRKAARAIKPKRETVERILIKLNTLDIKRRRILYSSIPVKRSVALI